MIEQVFSLEGLDGSGAEPDETLSTEPEPPQTSGPEQRRKPRVKEPKYTPEELNRLLIAAAKEFLAKHGENYPEVCSREMEDELADINRSVKFEVVRRIIAKKFRRLSRGRLLDLPSQRQAQFVINPALFDTIEDDPRD
jgi:hypothetical protein